MGIDPKTGVDLREEEQIEHFKQITEFASAAPWGAKKRQGLRYFYENDWYGYGDAITLFGMLMSQPPKRIIEIGSGFSTRLMADVNERFYGNKMSITVISGGISVSEQSVTVLKQAVQTVAVDVFADLDEGDMLFIDGSHKLGWGGDVEYMYWKALPSLRKGVLVHVHDIWYPFKYYDWMARESWDEAHVIKSLIRYSEMFEIVFWSHYAYPKWAAAVKAKMPGVAKNPGAQIWLRRI